MFDKENILIIGSTFEKAKEQYNNIANEYAQYGIKVTFYNESDNDIYAEFSNLQKFYVISFDDLKQKICTIKINYIYFDKEIPSNEYWDYIDTWVRPELRSPRTMWQF